MLEYADKKSGALMIWGSDITDSANGELYATVKTSLFLLGRGGFGYKGTVPKTNFPSPPKRAPDHTVIEKMPAN